MRGQAHKDGLKIFAALAAVRKLSGIKPQSDRPTTGCRMTSVARLATRRSIGQPLRPVNLLVPYRKPVEVWLLQWNGGWIRIPQVHRQRHLHRTRGGREKCDPDSSQLLLKAPADSQLASTEKELQDVRPWKVRR